MKRIIMFILGILLFAASSAWATWTTKVTDEGYSMDGHIFTWSILCTSDGSGMSATDILSMTGVDRMLKQAIQRSLQMTIQVVPGTGGVTPDATVTVSLSDQKGNLVYSQAGFPTTYNVTNSHDSLADDQQQYLDVGQFFYLTLNDIGTAGDQVTLRFKAWVEDK